MNNLAVFVIGAGIGAGAAYILTKRHYKKKLDDIYEKEDDAAFEKSVRERKTEKELEDGSIDDQLHYIDNFISDIFGKDDQDSQIEFLITLLEKRDVSLKYYEDDIEDGVNPINDDWDDADEAPEEEGGAVTIITEEDYNEPNTKWTRETIVFYDGDTTFVSEDGIVVDNWKQLFGDDILNWIQDHNFRKANLFIRNEPLTSDYQIVYKEIGYAEEGGELEDDYEPGDMAD